MNTLIYDINDSYMTIPTYGLVFHKNKLNNVLTNIQTFENIKNIRHDIKVQQAKEDYNKYIKEINITPVDKYCLGSCLYCYYNYIDDIKVEMTTNRLEEYFKKIQSYFHENMLFKFTGGSCFLHSDILSLIEVCKNYSINNSLYLRFHVDLIYPEKLYQKMLKDLTTLVSWKDVKKIELYITTDFGSDTRISTKLNLTTQHILERVDELIDLFEQEDKIQIELKTNYNKETNLDILFTQYNKYFSKNVWLISNPVRHLHYSPTTTQLLKIINKFENTYDTNIVYARQYVIRNEKVKKEIINNPLVFNTNFEQIDTNIYFLSKFSSDCIAFRHSFGVTTKSYLSCFTGYLESKKEENITKITNKCNNYDKFIKQPEECLKCYMLGVCMRCNLRRHSLSCVDVPSLKVWEKFLWDKKVSIFLKECVINE